MRQTTGSGIRRRFGNAAGLDVDFCAFDIPALLMFVARVQNQRVRLVIGLLQRVTEACVRVDGLTVGSIGRGLLVFIAVEPGDTTFEAQRLIDRLAAYRVFADREGRMNLSVTELGGEMLLVSQFTLAADTRKGLRPSFTTAAPPEQGQKLFEFAADHARALLPGRIATGRFGADMQVSLTNDGPVTFWLRITRGTATE